LASARSFSSFSAYTFYSASILAASTFSDALRSNFSLIRRTSSQLSYLASSAIYSGNLIVSQTYKKPFSST
jgi:hypothetical protein